MQSEKTSTENNPFTRRPLAAEMQHVEGADLLDIEGGIVRAFFYAIDPWAPYGAQLTNATVAS